MQTDSKDLADAVTQSAVLLARGIPDTMKAFRAVGTAAYSDGALSRQVKELIALALGIAAHCDGCVAWHARQLARLGVDRSAVIEAVGVTVQMGGGPSMVYGGAAIEAFDSFAATDLPPGG